jgi:hypothetical protein
MLKIDTSNVRFEVTGYPRPATDYNPDTRERTPKIDRRSGQPIWLVPMFISGVRRSVDVRVLGEPTDVLPDVPVKVTGLSVNHWRMEGRNNNPTREGVAYWAERIEAAVPTAKAS